MRRGVHRAALVGIIGGTVYGIVARFFASTPVGGALLGVMSLAFLFVVPFVIGTMTVSEVPEPSWSFRLFAPWVPVLFLVLFAMAIGWEGSICVIIGTPLLLLFASIGGLAGARATARRREVRPLLALLPLAAAPLERTIPPPTRIIETVTSIDIAAPPATVWPLVASVDSIRPEERHPALFTAMGFPRPVSATLSRPGVGGIRRARFERGLEFTETVTAWEPARRLAFTIDANTAAIPPTTLDEHVAIGGPYFDVLTGSYELFPTADGRGTHLVLRSTHRLSTRVNPYAAWWVNRVMASIQGTILEVHKGRAEQL